VDQQRRALAEADQRASELARKQAEQATMKADAARAAAEKASADAIRERAAADAARAAAEQQQQAALAEADRAKLGLHKAEAEKAELRESLRKQLNLILETRESARGLIVNISDVLFDFNKYTLKPGAREKLAKVAGILLAHPRLKIQVEGYTDSVGSEEYNSKLSQSRADSVRDYLGAQSVPASNVTAIGLGKSDPVASNDTAAGRQRNRRVELVVSGEAMGIGDITTASKQ
jgi:outer membrane protein OmpA-like peptidoglycan-associated protein